MHGHPVTLFLRYAHLKKEIKTEIESKKTIIENGALFVETTPPDSIIKIMNIKPKYHPGINLIPGRYHIKVSAIGFKTKSQWTDISPGEKRHLSITLVKAENKKDIQAKTGVVAQIQTQTKTSKKQPDKEANQTEYTGTRSPTKKILKESDAKQVLSLAILPWKLTDEPHWSPDLTRAKIVRSLIESSKQHANIDLKYSYYQFDNLQNPDIKLIKEDIRKFGPEKLWAGWSVIVSPSLSDVSAYCKKIKADLALMGNIMFQDIDGQPGSSKYHLNLFLVDVIKGEIVKQSGYFHELNSIKTTKYLTNNLFNTTDIVQ